VNVNPREGNVGPLRSGDRCVHHAPPPCPIVGVERPSDHSFLLVHRTQALANQHGTLAKRMVTRLHNLDHKSAGSAWRNYQVLIMQCSRPVLQTLQRAKKVLTGETRNNGPSCVWVLCTSEMSEPAAPEMFETQSNRATRGKGTSPKPSPLLPPNLSFLLLVTE
jgi:hypothetical protein